MEDFHCAVETVKRGEISRRLAPEGGKGALSRWESVITCDMEVGAKVVRCTRCRLT